jgi:hypothetical protein
VSVPDLVGARARISRRCHLPGSQAADAKAAEAKAANKTSTDDPPVGSFTALLDHLATLTRNHLRVAGHDESGLDR